MVAHAAPRRAHRTGVQMPQDAPYASVIVPTYNRSALLSVTLASLELQNVPPGSFEVVVADDGSSDDTEAVVEGFAGRGPVRYAFQEDLGHRPAAARNTGARQARGDVLIFLDTGTLAGPGFVRSHVEAVTAADPERARKAVLGYTYGYNPWQIPEALRPLVAELTPEQIVDRLGREPGFRDMRHDTLDAVGDDLRRVHLPWMLFWTMNVSLAARDFRAVGGFDEDFQGWGCEDSEFAYRLSSAGLDFVVSRDAWAIEAPHDRDLAGIGGSVAKNSALMWSKHPVPAMEMHWGIQGNGFYEPPLEEAYAAFARWRAQTARQATAAEVSETVERHRPSLAPAGSVLVVGADRDFVPPPGALRWTALCPDGDLPSPRAEVAMDHAIGLRTTYQDQSFDLVVLTSRLAGLWPSWGELLQREANRLGRAVAVTPRLREALAPGA